ncbi:DNA polymerase lambda [Mollisia scopiformis]|uniref:DNA polymerase n=1 Tax=Mollisia scopiformis TaxID=149040 RepID=A0A194XJN7_MOLSC|nr:DNA polymerase lambda [Mollisia scopiformis]KUJ20319.1 DNA polymerase lambda [Mollisia scopiformis]
MLKKKTNAAAKRKRKDKLVMKSESERIFTGKTFLFIPNDDIEPFRRARIMDVRSRGGVWTQEWTPDITHVVVDKTLKLEQVMSFLKPMMKSDSLPSNVIMVNEEYPPDCVVNGILVDETQGRYAVKKMKAPEEQEPQSTKPPPTLSIQKPKSKKKDHETPEERTQRSEPSTQPLHSGVPNSSFSGRLPPTDESLVESPRERSPILDNYDGISSVLDEFIKQARDTKDLPLDDEDEEVDRPSSSERDPDQEGSSEEDHRPPTKKKKKKSKKSTGSGQKGLDQDKYSCMHAGEVIEDNLNSDTIDILTRLADYYDRVKDQWRALAYKRASGTLRTQSTKIRTYEEAIDLLFIGESIAKKIEEIVVTGRLRKLEYAELEPDDLVLQLFLKIYGVGPSEASKFIQAGHKTLEDLRTKARLTEGQEIGLEHYDDFNTRIPRDEMTALGVIVKETAKAIDPDVELIIGGSYRRGASTSGDIDFIVTKPNTDNSRDLLPFLYKLVDELTRKEFLTAALAVPGHREGSGSKWHGACVLPGNPIWRRIDFLLVPETEIGAALIYFTGDDIFNRSIRLLAGHKGYSLNQRGLYRDVLRGPGRKKLTDGELVEGSDERRIFEILGIPWRRPEHRILQ